MSAPPVPRIGRYRLDGVVGAGAFATVHRAIDDRLGDTVALKVLAENHCLDPDMRERFIAEGRALRRVDSPHVLRVHDIGETDRQQPYLVLEHAERETLAQRVAARRDEGWSPGRDDLLDVARPLAGAVAAIHRADLVHRDQRGGPARIDPRADEWVWIMPDGAIHADETAVRLHARSPGTATIAVLASLPKHAHHIPPIEEITSDAHHHPTTRHAATRRTHGRRHRRAQRSLLVRSRRQPCRHREHGR